MLSVNALWATNHQPALKQQVLGFSALNAGLFPWHGNVRRPDRQGETSAAGQKAATLAHPSGKRPSESYAEVLCVELPHCPHLNKLACANTCASVSPSPHPPSLEAQHAYAKSNCLCNCVMTTLCTCTPPTPILDMGAFLIHCATVATANELCTLATNRSSRVDNSVPPRPPQPTLGGCLCIMI